MSLSITILNTIFRFFNFCYKPLIKGESKSFKKKNTKKNKKEYFIKINNKKAYDSFMSNLKGEIVILT